MASRSARRPPPTFRWPIGDYASGDGDVRIDNGTGRRFLTRSRLFSDDELTRLAPV